MAAASSAVQTTKTSLFNGLPIDLWKLIAATAGLSGRALACANRALRQKLSVNSFVKSIDIFPGRRILDANLNPTSRFLKVMRLENSDLQRIVEQHPNLTDLDLFSCVSQEFTSLTALRNLCSLKKLALGECCHLRDDSLASLAGLPIEHLDLCDYVLKENDYHYLAPLAASLRELVVGSTSDPLYHVDPERLRLILPRTNIKLVELRRTNDAR
jgi:hypothetical protein